MMSIAAVTLALLLLQTASVDGGVDRSIPACKQTKCTGTPIKDHLGVLQFCVPGGMKVQREVGEHGDVTYAITARSHGKPFELLIISGPYFSGKLPDWARGCKVDQWRTPEWKGEDCRTRGKAGRSRYLTLNAPMGYAVYRDAPSEVAARFDGVLDSVCWYDWRSAVGMR